MVKNFVDDKSVLGRVSSGDDNWPNISFDVKLKYDNRPSIIFDVKLKYDNRPNISFDVKLKCDNNKSLLKIK